jgi:hypothetical protein
MDLSDILGRIWGAYSTGWGLWVSGAMYVWYSLCLMAIAQKSHVPLWWAGWVPLVNFKVLCDAGKAPANCVWRLLLSVVAIAVGVALWIPWWIVASLALWAVVWTVVWIRVCRERNRPLVLGLLSPVPVLGLVLFGVLAFGD